MTSPPANPSRPTIGCVSFLNAKPLVDGLDRSADVRVSLDVPSRLLDALIAGRVDVALCPVIDYQTARVPLQIVPVGGIGCDGPTLTVRLFARCPIDQIEQVYVDTDSHTSIALMRIVLHDQYGLKVSIAPYRADDAAPQALLLIGDKVVHQAPSTDTYPHQMDLGAMWKQLTGLPFVFAVWMAQADVDLGPLPELLQAVRQANEQNIASIVRRHGPRLGWPTELAEQYLGQLLRYEIGPRQFEAMQRFWQRAHELEIIDRLEPLRLYGPHTAPAAL